MKKLSLLLIALMGIFILAGCEKDETKPTQNIVQLAQAQPTLSSLVTALTKFPDLVETLQGTGNFTVFAPTNDAFTALLATIGQTTINDVPEPVLKSLLQYHVVTTGAVLSTQLTAGNVVTANTESIAVTTMGGISLNGSTKVLTADVKSTNGVVHIIDKVLVPASIVKFVNTVVEPAYFNKNFTTLIAAVTAASPSILVTLLNSSKKTLFAPNNDAFTAAGITTPLPDRATLDAVLTYHLIGSEVRASQLPTNTAPSNNAITTLGGVFYLSNRGATGVFINGRTKVIATDILADNGVVHVIDRTLMPPSQTIAQIATALSTPANGEFKQLVAALVRVPALLDAASAASSNLTVFAPTDAAFRELYTALGVAGINDINLNTLTAVLQHHIISSPITATGRIFSRDLVTGSVTTLNGNISISATAGTVTSGNGTAANISANAALINVLGTNGVIHTINKVLVPSAK